MPLAKEKLIVELVLQKKSIFLSIFATATITTATVVVMTAAAAAAMSTMKKEFDNKGSCVNVER